MKSLLFFCFLLVISRQGHSQGADTFQVHFSLNDTKLSLHQSNYIDSLILNNNLLTGHKLILLGYTDYLGSAMHNDSLSRERAKNVEDHLLASGFNKRDITLCTGEGEIKRGSQKTKEGYTEDRKVLIIMSRNKNPETQNIIDINKVKVNETVALKNIFFREGLPDISPYSIAEMEQLVFFLKENKGVTIRVEGHICCMAPEEGTDVPYDTSTLSKMRAKAVCDYLVAKGVDKTRLNYIGLGNTRPAVSPEQTEEDMERIRRVEIRILSK